MHQSKRTGYGVSKLLLQASVVLLLIGLFSSCAIFPGVVEAVVSQNTETANIASITFTPTASQTPEPTFTPSPSPTNTPAPTATPDRNDPANWLWYEAGQSISAPILLYHHVQPEYVNNDYYLTVELFTQQMDWLLQEGYTSVTASQLVDTLIHGGYLPEKPVVITFDDGFIDVFQYAYPVLKERSMVATWYVVASYLNALDCVTTEQALELISNGWEIGSHSMTHQDLQYTQDTNYEMAQSRTILMNELNVPINTFAYPYGSVNEYVFEKAIKYGFTAGMGLGTRSVHDLSTLFYLSRLVVTDGMTSADIAAMIRGK